MFLDDEGLAEQFSEPGADVSATLGGLGGLAGLLGGGRKEANDEKKGIAGLLGGLKKEGRGEKEGIAGLLGGPKGEKKGIAGLLGRPKAEEKKGFAGLLGPPKKDVKLVGLTSSPKVSDQKAAANAALSNPLFAKKRLDASKFVGAGSSLLDGGAERAKTPMVTVKR